MKALGLGINHRRRINNLTGQIPDICSKLFLAHLLDIQESFLHRRIIHIFQKIFKMMIVLLPCCTDRIIQQFPQLWVAVHQPPARGNTIGLVLDQIRIQTHLIAEQIILQNFRMDASHAIDRMRANQCQCCHMQRAVTQRTGAADKIRIIRALLPGPGTIAPVYFRNNHGNARQQILNILHRPFFQSLGHNRMIGIGNRFLHNLPCLVPGVTVFIHQYPHQLRNHQHRVCIVELDGNLLAKIVQRRMVLQMGFHNGMHTGTDKEIFLFQAQILSFLSGIIRINIQTDRFHIRKILAIIPVTRRNIRRFCTPQTQCIHRLCMGTDHRHVIWHSKYMAGVAMPEMHITIFIITDLNLAIELHIHGMLEFADLPRIANPHPHIRHFYLLTIFIDKLTEQPCPVADAVAIYHIVLTGSRVHKACRQTAKTAIAKTRIILLICNFLIGNTKLLQSLCHDVINAKILQIACQHPAQQKLHRKVIHLLEILRSCFIFGILPVI